MVQQRREEEEGDEWKTRARGLVERLVAEIDLSFGLGGGGGGGGGPSPSLPPPASPDVVSAQDGLGVLDSARSRGSANNVGRGDYEGYLANPNIVLFGSLHESTVKIMNGLGLLPAELVGADIPYRKYHFNLRYVEHVRSKTRSRVAYDNQRRAHFLDYLTNYYLPKQQKHFPRHDSSSRLDVGQASGRTHGIGQKPHADPTPGEDSKAPTKPRHLSKDICDADSVEFPRSRCKSFIITCRARLSRQRACKGACSQIVRRWP